MATGLAELAEKAGLVRRAITVGLLNADELVDDGWVVLYGPNGEPIEKSKYDDSVGHTWSITVDAVLLLHLFEPEWFHAWRSQRRGCGRENGN